MSLNFNSLPNERSNSNAVFPKAVYLANIKKAEMRTSGGGKTYLVAQLTINNGQGETITVFDNFFDVDKPTPRFKIAQFLRALNTIPQGDFELADLVKIVPNKFIKVALTSEQNSGYAPRNIVDVFDKEIYYPVTDKDRTACTQPTTEPINATDDDLPFNMDDDAPTSGSESY